MELTINTPFSHDKYSVAWLELNTPAGNYIIQHGHAPTILSLSPKQKIVFRLKIGKEESILVRQGIAHIDRESTTVIMTKQER